MKYCLHLAVAACCMLVYCDSTTGVKSIGPKDVLIRRDFIDDSTYRVVCRGFPEQGLRGVQKVESSKRAALLNAYYFIRGVFGDAVAPDVEGRAEKFEVMADHAVVHYTVKKKGLRALVIEAAVPQGDGPAKDGE